MTEIRHKNHTLLGTLAATAVYAIYGLNVVFCKDLTAGNFISPTVLFTLRTGGAALLFWVLSIFLPKERLSAKELGLTVLASVLCVILPQYSTLIGVTMSTPYDASLVSTVKPVLTMTLAFLLGKEKFSPRLLIGVLLTFLGAVALVIRPARTFSTSLPGLLILLVNGISFSFYLVLFKEFVSRHKIVTMMRWMFLVAFLVSLPFAAPSIPETRFTAFNGIVIWEILFLIVFATFLSHFLMPVGQRNLTSTQYSLFIYVQCIVAAVVGYFMGLESLDWQKLAATLLFIAGVAVVRRA